MTQNMTTKRLARLRGDILKAATIRLLVTYYLILILLVINSTLYDVNNLSIW